MNRSALFYSNEVQQYAVPFMGADPSVVKRSQRFLLEEHQETPVCHTNTLHTRTHRSMCILDVMSTVPFCVVALMFKLSFEMECILINASVDRISE